MKTYISFLIVFILSFYNSLLSQPSAFSWDYRHYHATKKIVYDYISDAKDQEDQGPCGIFATVAAVEAMTQIYYNKSVGTEIDLSESNIYNSGGGDCPGYGCEEGAADTPESLYFIKTYGIVNEDCFSFPEDEPWCWTECDICATPAQEISIPYYSQITPSDAAALKTAIMDYGPLILHFGNSNIGCLLHPGDDCTYTHTVLIIGWQTTSTVEWRIKDSWPNAPGTYNTSLNIFDYSPTFYRVYANYGEDEIECSGSSCSAFSNRYYVDNDGDGFYNWGLDNSDRPDGCTGPDKMDFDDGNPNYIFRDGNNILLTPTISFTAPVCYGSVISLNNPPSGFDVSWAITESSSCFNSPISGSGYSATVYPKSTCVGIEAEITFTISHGGGSASYSKSFYANCPREDLMSISVLDSYGGSPPKYGDTYYLCPYTTYNIFFYENDPDCSVTITDWDLPYGWSEHYRYSNYISIYTNDWPDGFLDIIGNTSCATGVTLMSPYFGEAECDGYFIAYPNPSESFVDIDVDKVKLQADNISIDGECLITIVDKSGMVKFKTEFKGFPYRIDSSGLPDGLYFINIVHKGKISTIRLIIQHP